MKKLLFIPMFALVLFSMVMVSSANAITLTLPVQDASISGSYVLSGTLDTNTINITSATFFYNDGSSNITIGTTANDSATVFNYTWDTTALVDVNNYVIWVNATNESGILLTSDSSTGVDIDNGDPTATLSSSSFADNLALITSTSFTVAIDADSSIGISSCTVYFTNSETGEITTKSVSASGNACTTTTTPSAESLGVNEIYTVMMEATDGNSDAVNSSSRTLRVTPASGGGGGSVVEDLPIITRTKSMFSGFEEGFANIQNRIANMFSSINNFFKGLFNR